MDAGSSVTRSPRVSLPSPVPPSITREALATPHQVTFLVLRQHFPKVASGLGRATLSQSLGLYFFCTNHPPPGSAVHASALPHRQGGSRPVIRVSPQSAFPERPGSPPPITQRPGHQPQLCPCDHVIVLGESLVQFKGKV